MTYSIDVVIAKGRSVNNVGFKVIYFLKKSFRWSLQICTTFVYFFSFSFFFYKGHPSSRQWIKSKVNNHRQVRPVMHHPRQVKPAMHHPHPLKRLNGVGFEQYRAYVQDWLMGGMEKVSDPVKRNNMLIISGAEGKSKIALPFKIIRLENYRGRFSWLYVAC